MKTLHKPLFQFTIVVLFVAKSSLSWALTASEAYAKASAAAVNVVPPEPKANYSPIGPLCNPPGCTPAPQAPPDLSPLAMSIINTAFDLHVVVAPCDNCGGSFFWDPASSSGNIFISPNIPSAMFPSYLLHEDIHYLSSKYDGPLNFGVNGFATGSTTYGAAFDASEPLAYATGNALLGSSATYAAQYNAADLADLVLDYYAKQDTFTKVYGATNSAVSTFSAGLNESGIVGQLLNAAGNNYSYATLPDGSMLLLYSNPANSSSSLTLYDSANKEIGSLDFNRSADMSSQGGRAQLVDYVLNKLGHASTVLGSINPALPQNSAIAAQNEQAISLAEQIVMQAPAAAPSCDIGCQMRAVDNLLKTNGPAASVSIVAANSATAINNAKTIVTPPPPPATGASCTLNGITVPFGQTINTYAMHTAYRSCGDTCSSISQVRTCGSGGLSDGYSFTSCTQNTKSACP